MKNFTLAAIVLFVIVLGILVFVLGYTVPSVEFGLLEVHLQPPTTSIPIGMQEKRSAPADRSSSQSPEGFIHNYYQLINARRYSEAWDLLTPYFRRSKTPNGFSKFENAWRRYGRVSIQSVVIEDQTENTARFTVQLDYFDIQELLVVRMWLIHEATQQQWNIDRSEIISETPY